MNSFQHSKGKLKNRLFNNEVTIGTWLTIPHQAIIEILASAGFEWITIDIEHASIDYKDVANLIGHIQGNGMEALVRVSKNEEVVIKRVLDAGANGVIVPMINSKQDVDKMLSFIHYPPKGKRGVGLSRAQHYGNAFESYKEWLDKEVVVIIQIEHIVSVNNLESILDVKGIDGVIVGPYDLSGSMNKPGNFNETDFKEALRKIETNCFNKKIPLGFHVIQPNAENVIEKIDKGYTFLAFSLDFMYLGVKARDEMVKLRRI